MEPAHLRGDGRTAVRAGPADQRARRPRRRRARRLPSRLVRRAHLARRALRRLLRLARRPQPPGPAAPLRAGVPAHARPSREVLAALVLVGGVSALTVTHALVGR